MINCAEIKAGGLIDIYWPPEFRLMGFYCIHLYALYFQAVPIGTFCLGTWQVQRRQWKLNLIDELDSKTKAAAIQFPEKYVNFLLR